MLDIEEWLLEAFDFCHAAAYILHYQNPGAHLCKSNFDDLFEEKQNILNNLPQMIFRSTQVEKHCLEVTAIWGSSSIIIIR